MLPRHFKNLGFVFALSLIACDQPYEDLPAIDPSAPRVHITGPERGVFAGAVDTIEVKGTWVDDDGTVTSIEVNGVTAKVSGDGTWSATGAHDFNVLNSDMRSYVMTTIRDAPNPRGTASYMNNVQCNTPLTSAHPGGVQVGLADGSVRFLTDNVNLVTFKHLADRDDGNAIGEF